MYDTAPVCINIWRASAPWSKEAYFNILNTALRVSGRSGMQMFESHIQQDERMGLAGRLSQHTLIVIKIL